MSVHSYSETDLGIPGSNHMLNVVDVEQSKAEGGRNETSGDQGSGAVPEKRQESLSQAETLETAYFEDEPKPKNQAPLRFLVDRLRLAVHLTDDKWEERPHCSSDAWLLHPQSTIRLYWDTIMLIILCVILVVLPVSISFFYNDNGHSWLSFFAFCDVIFVVDIILNFRTGTYANGDRNILIGTSGAIAKRYAKSWLVVDLLSVIPVQYILLAGHTETQMDYSEGSIVQAFRLVKLMELTRLLRFSRVHRYFAMWGRILDLTSSMAGYVQLLTVMFLLCHWNACLQYLVPALQGFPARSWVTLGGLQDKGWFEIYTNALYKTVSNMITTGYGAYNPITTSEVLAMIWSMVSACILYALFTGYTIQLINKYNLSGKAFQTRMQEVHDYVVARKLPRALEIRVRDYYEQRYNGKLFDEEAIFSELSESLKLEILNHTCRNAISKIPIFRSVEPNFTNDMVCILRQELFQPGDVVIKANTKATKMYFIREGLLEILTPTNDFLKNVRDGSYFGEISMLTNLPRTATVRAVTQCAVLSMTKEQFQLIFSQYPAIKRSLAVIASKRLHSLVEDVHIDRATLLMHLHAVYSVINDAPQSPVSSSGHENNMSSERNVFSAFRSMSRCS